MFNIGLCSLPEMTPPSPTTKKPHQLRIKRQMTTGTADLNIIFKKCPFINNPSYQITILLTYDGYYLYYYYYYVQNNNFNIKRKQPQ